MYIFRSFTRQLFCCIPEMLTSIAMCSGHGLVSPDIVQFTIQGVLCLGRQGINSSMFYIAYVSSTIQFYSSIYRMYATSIVFL